MGVLEIRLFEITQPGCTMEKDTFQTFLEENVIQIYKVFLLTADSVIFCPVS